MDSLEEIKTGRYFRLRGVEPISRLDPHLERYIPSARSTGILDIGCGLCDALSALKARGYERLKGIDISDEACEFGRKHGIDVEKISDIETYAQSATDRFDVIIISHVLEHLEKSSLISVLSSIRSRLLCDNGMVYIRVPNAMANTGCYWAYEDLTHTTMFTPGSIHFALRASGFSDIRFLDPKNLEFLSFSQRTFRRIFLKIYTLNRHFWNLVTNSWYYYGVKNVPEIFGFEIRVVARA